MTKKFQFFEYIYVYLSEILVLMAGYWTNHSTKLEQVLIKLQEKGLKYNIEKYLFVQSKMEYLSLWVAREGVSTTEKNKSHSRYGSPNK